MISTNKSKIHGFAFLYTKNGISNFNVSNFNVSNFYSMTIYYTTAQNNRSFRLIKL